MGAGIFSDREQGRVPKCEIGENRDEQVGIHRRNKETDERFSGRGDSKAIDYFMEKIDRMEDGMSETAVEAIGPVDEVVRASETFLSTVIKQHKAETKWAAWEIVCWFSVLRSGFPFFGFVVLLAVFIY